MKAEAAVQFLAALGVHNPIVTAQWVSGPCVLAPFTHRHGKDTNPSFGISLETGRFNCFACQSGTLETLIQTLEFHVQQNPYWESKYNFAVARQVLDGILTDLEVLPEYAEFPNEKHVFEPWPEYYIDQFPRADQNVYAMEYLASREVSTDLADRMELHWDPAHRRIVCPYRTFDGILAGARGRAVDPDAKVKHWDYTWNKVNNANLVWYHEQALDMAVRDDRPVVVVEGQFDALNVMRVYPYVVAGLTAKVSLAKMYKLRSLTVPVALMLDHDDTGEQAFARYEKYLGDRITLGRMVYPPEVKDPGGLSLGQLQEVFADLVVDKAVAGD